MSLLLLTGLASAQDINAQLFRPSVDAAALFWTDDARRTASGHLSGQALFSYANDPLVYTYTHIVDGERVALVSDLLQMDLLGGYTLGRARLGAVVPLYLRAVGDVSGSETGLGDIGADLKLSLIDGPLGLALDGRVSLPTATVEAPLGGTGTGWEASLVADRAMRRLLLAANVGTRGVPTADLENISWDDQFFFRTGAGYAITDAVGASAELVGSFTYGEWANYAAAPIEVMAGSWLRPQRGDWLARAGLGTGLTAGIGAPRFRAVLSIGYAPRIGTDTDGDGVIDDFDDCPERPEDLDGHDDRDGCPDPTFVTFRFVDASTAAPLPDVSFTVADQSGVAAGLPIFSGDHILTAEATGYEPTTTTVTVPGGERYEVVTPLTAIVPGRLTVQVRDGEGDRITGARWLLDGVEQGEIETVARTALLPGTYRIAATADGYLRASEEVTIQSDVSAAVALTLRTTTTRVTDDRIDLGGKIFFETGRATIKDESHALLEDVAQIMREYPEIRKVRVEGHTDSRGREDANLVLSQARAAAVVQFLTDRGVEPSRLNSIGFGESRPMAAGSSAAALAQNRRVDFFIEERDGAGPGEAEPDGAGPGEAGPDEAEPDEAPSQQE